jgi:uncharacterized protein (TIGR00251 family)
VISIEPHADGAVLPVRAHAGARRNEIHGHQDGTLKVSVTQAPEKGKANKAIAAALAHQLGLRKSQVELLSGGTSTHKRFLVRGLTPEEVRTRLEAKGFGLP